MHRILFVDDEVRLLKGIRRALWDEPYEVTTAESGAEALELLKGTTFDIVVADERMPGMCGSELLSIVCKEYPETIRIILTGQASVDAAVRAINEGEVYRYLKKPFGADELAMVLRKALTLADSSRSGGQLLPSARVQAAMISSLEKIHPGISDIRRDANGVIQLDESMDIDELLAQVGIVD